MISKELLFCSENSKARSNDFAEKNGLQKYEYVLHPRTTGFTFVVDRLREGEHSFQNVHIDKVTAITKLYSPLKFIVNVFMLDYDTVF